MAQQNGFLDEGAVGRPTPIPSSDPSEAARATPVAAAPSQPDNSRTDIPLNSMEPSIEMAELGIPRGFSSIDESNHQGFAPLKHRTSSWYDGFRSLWRCGHDKNNENESDKVRYAELKYRNYRRYPPGWPRLAAILENPEQSMFRMFGYVQSRLLLEKQVEIADLETQLRNSDLDDYKRDAQSLRSIQGLREESEDRKRIKSELTKEIKEYVTLLLNFNQLRQICPAPEWKGKNLWHYLHREKGPLKSGDYNFATEVEDLKYINSDNETNWRGSAFEELLDRHIHQPSNSWLDCLMRDKSSEMQANDDFEDELESNPDEQPDNAKFFDKWKLIRLAKALGVVVIVLILLIPNFLLWLQPMDAAGTSSIFTVAVVIFVVGLSAFTNAKIQELVVAACGYCAVLVTILVVTRNAK